MTRYIGKGRCSKGVHGQRDKKRRSWTHILLCSSVWTVVQATKPVESPGTTVMSALGSSQKRKQVEMPEFHLETVYLLYTEAVGNYQQKMACELHNIKLAEEAIYIWNTTPNCTNLKSLIRCQAHVGVSKSHPPCINEMNQVSGLQPKENVYYRASEFEKEKKSCWGDFSKREQV